jgi:3-oxoacyl-[acyl-carrier-protein] synthase-3
MDGIAVFNFVQNDVPPLVDDLLARAEVGRDDVDYFMFHQPNRFILEKLADRMKVPRDKMPANIVENYGNPSSASVPAVICHNLGRELLEREFRVCLGGFGVGLTYSTMLLHLGELSFCEIMDYGGVDG